MIILRGQYMCLLRSLGAVALTLLLSPLSSQSQCLECHGDPNLVMTDSTGQVISLYVDSTVFQNSVHGFYDCQVCHTTITAFPHGKNVPRVDCSRCHGDVAEVYQWHGNHRQVAGDLMPDCHDCHGTHDILDASDSMSQVNPVNLVRTCGHCHQNPEIVGKYHIPMTKPIEVFETSVHSRRMPGTDSLAATCVDCHSYQGTGHMIMAPINPQSSIYHFNIPATCGRCHSEIAKRYEQGSHGQAAAKGEADSPVCTGCHSDHEILPMNDPRSPISPTNVSMTICAPCHESSTLNLKYGFNPGVMKSWLHSYHGLKSTDGDPTVANCASCHRRHVILPASDSLSSIAPANVQQTCALCHPGITKALAGIPIHGIPGIYLNPTGKVFRDIYIFGIILIIGAMVVHLIIDLLKQFKLLNQGRQIVRMKPDELLQHTILMVTFIVLAITGFAFHYSGSFWAKFLFGWPGGFMVRRIIHRVASVIFIMTTVWHIIYLFHARGKQFMRDVFPTRKDFIQFIQTMAYDLGFRKEPPRFGRFSYIEKAEYWALVWGTVVMIITGISLWFGAMTERFMHVGTLGVMLVIHFYEAILASLAILIWHMYSTVFNPAVYPNNPSWYTGKMPEKMYHHEHPEDPVLKNDKTDVEEKAEVQ